jgi:hypothetical protein
MVSAPHCDGYVYEILIVSKKRFKKNKPFYSVLSTVCLSCQLYNTLAALQGIQRSGTGKALTQYPVSYAMLYLYL